MQQVPGMQARQLYAMRASRGQSPASESHIPLTQYVEPGPRLSGISLNKESVPLATYRGKLAVIIAAIIPMAPSTLLLYWKITDMSFQGTIVLLSVSQRANVQIIVTILSTLLSFLNTYSFISLRDFASRISLARTPTAIRDISYCSARKTKSVSFNHSISHILTLILVAGILALHQPLWVGAITPIVTSKALTRPYRVPAYSNSSAENWRNMDLGDKDNCQAMYREGKGSFSHCAALTLSSQLLTSASRASKIDNTTHSKNDETQYSYKGRSYGVGASVGLADLANSSSIEFYNYTESGYNTQVQCIHNATSDWHLEEKEAGKPANGIPYIYYAIGRFPNGDWSESASPDFWSVVGLYNSDTIVALGVHVGDGTYIAALTAGESYKYLNQTQCTISYTPTEYQVSVNNTEKLIHVEPKHTDNAKFDPTLGLAAAAGYQLNAVGMSATSLHYSWIGEALLANIKTKQTISNNTAVAESLMAILDDILVFIASYQLLSDPEGAHPNTRSIDVTVRVQAIHLGQSGYVYIIMAVCVFHLGFMILEVVRTAQWTGLPAFDMTDAGSLILTSAAAGDKISDKVRLVSKKHTLVSEAEAQSVKLRLCMTDRGETLAPEG